MEQATRVQERHAEWRLSWAGRICRSPPVTTPTTDAGLRIADLDREDCVEQLQQHFVAGRLDRAELEDRVGQALVARNRGQLDALVSDCEALPVAVPVAPARTPRRRLRGVVAGLAGTVLLGGFVVLNAPTVPAEAPPPCVSTGVPAPATDDCPALSSEQQQVVQDAQDAARAAAEVATLSNATVDSRLDVLREQARAASQRAQQAVDDAEVVVATSGSRLDRQRLEEPVQEARSAAADAARLLDEAEQVADR
jgi:hypothetical protein